MMKGGKKEKYVLVGTILIYILFKGRREKLIQEIKFIRKNEVRGRFTNKVLVLRLSEMWICKYSSNVNGRTGKVMYGLKGDIIRLNIIGYFVSYCSSTMESKTSLLTQSKS